MAIGAYTMAILVVNASFPLWAASLAAIGAAVAFGLLLGLPTLRLRADYLASRRSRSRRSCATSPSTNSG